MLTPGQRYEIGKWAAEHGVTVTLRYYTEKYLISMQKVKGLYKDPCWEQFKPCQASAGASMFTLVLAQEKKTHCEDIKELPWHFL